MRLASCLCSTRHKVSEFFNRPQDFEAAVSPPVCEFPLTGSRLPLVRALSDIAFNDALVVDLEIILVELKAGATMIPFVDPSIFRMQLAEATD